MIIIILYYFTYYISTLYNKESENLYDKENFIVMKFRSLSLYFLLFRINFSISAFTFGGGYVVIPMMKKYFVNNLKLISEEELMDMAAISQSTPGAIAVNIAVLVGYRIAGLTGAIISCIGTIVPPLIILTIISSFYSVFRDNRIISSILKGMEAGVVAVIVDLVIDMSIGILKERNWLLTAMVPCSFFLSFFLNINVVLIIISCAFLCFVQTYLRSRKGRKKYD